MNHDDSDAEDIEDVVGESDQDSDAEEDLPLELDDGRSANKKDEMEVEHLATLERLRQTQRQDYLRVSLDGLISYGFSDQTIRLGFRFWQRTGYRPSHEGAPRYLPFRLVQTQHLRHRAGERLHLRMEHPLDVRRPRQPPAQRLADAEGEGGQGRHPAEHHLQGDVSLRATVRSRRSSHHIRLVQRRR